MQITISGKQVDVGASLRGYIEETLAKTVSKYFENAVRGDVVIKKERHLFHVDLMVNEGTGTSIVIKADGESEDVYAAFDMACERVEKQLRRYKRRIKNHHKHKLSEDFVQFAAVKYVLSPEDEAHEQEESKDTPLIIAEKPTHIETLTVGEAVMKMDLANLPALMFINRKTGNVSVVYKRQDGNISWVDSGLGAVLHKSAA